MLDFIPNFIIGTEIFVIVGIIVVLSVVGAIVIIKSISKKIPTGDKKRLSNLKDRLSKGEITKEEYDDLKKEFE
jgi:uncharacterized membrane protein